MQLQTGRCKPFLQIFCLYGATQNPASWQFEGTSRWQYLQKSIQNDLLLDLETGAQHRELSIYNLLVLGKHPEERFSLKSTDNLLTQQLLNLSCLSNEPAYLHQISAVAMLAWSLWPTFCTWAPRDCWQLHLLTMIHTVWQDNDSFLQCNKIASGFCRKVIFW